MSNVASYFLYCMNTITCILGAAMLGLGIYVRVNFAAGWESIVSVNAVYAGIAAGVLMMLVSFLGCAAAKKYQSKFLVFVYAFLVCGVLALQIAAAVLMMQYSGRLEIQSTQSSSQLVDTVSMEINNGILSVYTSCCSGCETQCNNAQPYFNFTLPNCLGANCGLVQACNTNDNVTDGCNQFPASYAAVKLNPTTYVDQGMCSLLSVLEFNSSFLVGSVSTGACGRGDPSQFADTLNAYFSSRFMYIGIGFCVIAGIQALVVLASLYIMCCGKNRPD